MSTVSITVDIEDWYHIPSVCSSPFSRYRNLDHFFSEWKERYDYLSEPTARVLDLLDDYAVRATFFVVADTVARYPGLVDSIVARGHEIACHGWDHSCKIDPRTRKPLFEVEEFKVRTRKAKALLEQTARQKIVGYRAPNALVGGWMLDALEEMGFSYDSSASVNSLYNKSDAKLTGVSSYPYYPGKSSVDAGAKRDLVEFPWAYYDLGVKVPTGGGPMIRFLGAEMILKGLRQSLKRGHTVFYFHPIDISTEKFPAVGNKRPFYWTIKGNVVERRIRHILDELKSVEKICLKDAREKLQ